MLEFRHRISKIFSGYKLDTLYTNAHKHRGWFLLLLALFAGPAAFADEAANGAVLEPFTVQRGYLSSSVRQLVSRYHWALRWDSAEDRVIEHPFVIHHTSLEDGLNNLLAVYRGAFVADLYARNQVVRIVTPAPGIEVELPVGSQTFPDQSGTHE